MSCTGDLLCVLTYGDGSAADAKLDIAINYTLLFATAALFIFGGPPKRRAAILAFFAAFQLGLCYVIGCAGVSMIWCACAGGGALDHHSGRRLVAFRVVSAAVVASLIYYAMVAEAITDIAHVCALTMGFLVVQADELYTRRLERDADYETLPPGTPRARLL
ncbi:unnamed protein product [Pelagomonas calceolata]|uniref:Uncharacterized protein n=1 Tax=Pelagomonas calceolata TaxID=35677 RepID=A0A8J2WX01_9STRA|nr:unnamed protein product [Pelagomonas calceolata]